MPDSAAQARYNRQRRERYRAERPLKEKACVVCGASFVGRPDRIVCSQRCRDRRKREQRRAA